MFCAQYMLSTIAEAATTTTSGMDKRNSPLKVHALHAIEPGSVPKTKSPSAALEAPINHWVCY